MTTFEKSCFAWILNSFMNCLNILICWPSRNPRCGGKRGKQGVEGEDLGRKGSEWGRGERGGGEDGCAKGRQNKRLFGGGGKGGGGGWGPSNKKCNQLEKQTLNNGSCWGGLNMIALGKMVCTNMDMVSTWNNPVAWDIHMKHGYLRWLGHFSLVFGFTATYPTLHGYVLVIWEFGIPTAA